MDFKTAQFAENGNKPACKPRQNGESKRASSDRSGQKAVTGMFKSL
jgi:hypothetical protein